MSSLLPSNATQLEQDLELVTLRGTAMPVVMADLWNPDTCPENLLNYLAWSLSIDEWDEAWPEMIKRDICRFAIEVHRYKGTVYAARIALEKSGLGDAVMHEGRSGYRRDGFMIRDGFMLHGDQYQWAVYKIVTAKLLSVSQANSARRLLAMATPVRCHLWGIDFTAATPLHNGVITRDGTYTRGVA